jgi:hypothetical protein
MSSDLIKIYVKCRNGNKVLTLTSYSCHIVPRVGDFWAYPDSGFPDDTYKISEVHLISYKNRDEYEIYISKIDNAITKQLCPSCKKLLKDCLGLEFL